MNMIHVHTYPHTWTCAYGHTHMCTQKTWKYIRMRYTPSNITYTNKINNAHTHAYAYTRVHTHTRTRDLTTHYTHHIHISWTQGNHPQKFTNTGYYRIITHVFQHSSIHTIISSISYRYHGNKPYSTRIDTVGTKNCYNAVAITNALDTTMALKNITPPCKAEACHRVTPKARVTVHMELQCE